MIAEWHSTGTGTLGVHTAGFSRLDKRLAADQRGVILVPGGAGTEDSWAGANATNPGTVTNLIHRLCDDTRYKRRFLTFHSDWTWGDDVESQRILDGITHARANYQFKNDKVHLIGVSMGGPCVLNFAYLYPSLVASVSTMIGAVDPQDIETNSRVSVYNLPQPSTAFGGLVANWNFATNTTGWGTLQGGSGTATLTRTAGSIAVYDGEGFFLRVVTPGSVAFEGIQMVPDVAVNGGTTYTASAYVKAPTGHVMNIRLAESAGGTAQDTQAWTADGTFQRVSVTHTMGSGVTSADIRIFDNTTEAITFDVDSVQLIQGTTRKVPDNRCPATHASDFQRFPLGMWYSNNDTVCVPTASTTFALGAQAEINHNLGNQFPPGFGIPGHDFSNLNLNDVADFIEAND